MDEYLGKQPNESDIISSLLDDRKLKQLIWEDWESEIKEEDPRQMVFKYMKLMRNELVEFYKTT
jgi:hypothetical protein